MAVKTILTVDDSLIAHQIIESIMKEAEGYEVVGHALDGAQALKLYAELRPDIVLLDIIMPDKDGLETLAELLEYDADAKVVMASSYGTVTAVERAMEIGAKGFVQKPYEPDALLRLLDEKT